MSESPSFDASSTAEEVTAGLDLSGTTWLITGCNSGLGHESARVLALRGASIVGLARTKAKADAALAELGIDGVGVACELSDLGSVRAAVEAVSALGPLDGILANAGIMALPELQQVHGYELQFFTNHVGHHVLITGLLDRLTDTGRVVVLSSGAHYYAKPGMELENLDGATDYDPWRMYGRSKLANILFTRALSKRLEGTGKTANSLHPGVIDTNLGRHVPDRVEMYESMKDILKTVAQGAATQCYVAARPELAGVSGVYFSDCAPAKTLNHAKDDALAEALWERTEAIAAAL